jgi:hypothetical protein
MAPTSQKVWPFRNELLSTKPGANHCDDAHGLTSRRQQPPVSNSLWLLSKYALPMKRPGFPGLLIDLSNSSTASNQSISVFRTSESLGCVEGALKVRPLEVLPSRSQATEQRDFAVLALNYVESTERQGSR